jgi:tetratricopeptide (TPR) repeat protein
MKRLFFPIVLAGTIVIGGVLAYSIWKASPRTAQAYFDSGKKYYDEKKYPEAIIQLMNAVRKNGRDRQARYLLALSYLNQRDVGRAVAHLKALLEYYPDDVEANLQLGGIYLIAGRSDHDFLRQAQEIAQRVLAKNPQNVNAMILSGNASGGLQDLNSSVDQLEKALSLDPHNLAAFVSLGATQALQKNYAGAEQAFLKARETDPKNKVVLLALANFYRAAKEMDKAEAVYKEALSLYPTDRVIYLQVAQFYYQSGRFEQVDDILRDVQSKTTADPTPSLLLVQFYEIKGRPADARKLLLETKEKFPKNLDVAAKVAMNSLQDQPDRARVEIDQILKAAPKNPVGYLLLGQLQFFSGQYDAAEATFGKDPAVDSRFPQPHYYLGNISMRKGQLDEALFHYQKSLSLDSTYLPARTALAEVFLDKGRLADSKEEIRKALEIQPNYVPARMLKATLDTAEKNYAAAEREWAALSKELPDNAAVYRQMGFFLESRGRPADAEKNLIRALEIQPKSGDALRDLTLFYVRSKQTARALQKINSVPETERQALHYELLGIVYSQAGKLEDSEKAYKKALEKEPSRPSVEMYLFEDYMKSGRIDDALRKLDEVIKKNPRNGFLYTLKASIYESQGRTEEAKQIYAEALKADPESEIAANNLAFILAEEGKDLQSALSWAQMARKKQPENGGIADTLGWVYYKLGNYVLAREQVRFAASKQPENSVFQYHLGMIYKETKEISDAQTALKKALRASTDAKEKSRVQLALNDLAKLN